MAATEPPCADLQLCIDGELEADRRAAFQKHVARCKACRLELIKAAQLAALLSERREPR